MKISIQPKEINSTIKRKSIYTTMKFLFPNLKVGVVMPAYNEELNIGQTLEQIPENISEIFDVIVVDDGSVDKTSDIVKNYNVTLIKHSQNRGYGAAVRTGLDYCKKKEYDVVIILDTDGQHSPKYIKEFIKPIVEDDIDFVIGNRYKYYYDMIGFKKLCVKLMTALYMVFLQKKIMDPTNGYRSLSSKVVNDLELESEYSISQEMLFKVIPYYKYKEIPIKVYQRNHGQSFIKIKNYLLKIILLFLKFYIFPKVRKITHKILPEEFRTRVKSYYLKT
ncbi:MAG: glycosyltransferase family 2 protein [Candidatus Hermodarchaeota archaeon]